MVVRHPRVVPAASLKPDDVDVQAKPVTGMSSAGSPRGLIEAESEHTHVAPARQVIRG